MFGEIAFYVAIMISESTVGHPTKRIESSELSWQPLRKKNVSFRLKIVCDKNRVRYR